MFYITFVSQSKLKTLQHMKKNFRTSVFKRAYEMMKATGKTFSICLSKAWAIYRLSKRMKKETVRFTYEKADGTLRKAIGTLKDINNLIKGTGKENYKTFNYYDVEAKGFRSFKVENLISIF